MPTRVYSLLIALPLARASGRGATDSAELLRRISSSRPLGESDELDCTWRRLAFEYAPTLRTLTDEQAKDLHDALELDALCGVGFERAWHTRERRREPRTVAADDVVDGLAVYVQADGGDDDNPGTLDRPLRTPAAALRAVRRARAPDQPASIVLRGGRYRLNATLVLGAADSLTSIRAFDGETAVLSGALPLTGLNWTAPKRPGGAHAARLTDEQAAAVAAAGGITALRVDGRRATRARYPNADPERDRFPTGYIRSAGAADGNDWMAPIYPPYHRDGSRPCDPSGQCGRSATVRIDAPADEWHGMWQSWSEGYGGACEVYDPPRAPWCSASFYPSRQFPEMHYRSPSGLRPSAWRVLPHGPYARPAGAVVTAWRPFHWYSWMFEVGMATIGPAPNETALLFGKGGNQGGEGADRAAEWFIENVIEELDAPNEFFYDAPSQTLHLVYNGSASGDGGWAAADRAGPAAPPSSVDVPVLATLVEMRGAPAEPVRNVTLADLRFEDTPPSYMLPRGVPSGGDWALERVGALVLEGTHDALITGCGFERLDGNGVSLNGHNRRAAIVANEFAWLGQSAIASWGRLEGDTNSGLAGNQPRGTLVRANLARELGHYQKQSSFYFQALSAGTTLSRNVAYNLPRAAINFNDGFGGGHEVSENLLFNTCRESSDHAAFNSWDRLPYVTDVRSGAPSTIPALTRVRSNLIVSNYGANGGCLDNDDGSAYYAIGPDNVCYYGGHKSDFDGHSKTSSANLHIHPQVYGSRCVGLLQALPRSGQYAEGYTGNVCILPKAGDTYLDLGDCPGGLANTTRGRAQLAAGIALGNNTVYAPNGDAAVVCNGRRAANASDFLARGYDVGTVLRADVPDAATILRWARTRLGLGGDAPRPRQRSTAAS